MEQLKKYLRKKELSNLGFYISAFIFLMVGMVVHAYYDEFQGRQPIIQSLHIGKFEIKDGNSTILSMTNFTMDYDRQAIEELILDLENLFEDEKEGVFFEDYNLTPFKEFPIN